VSTKNFFKWTDIIRGNIQLENSGTAPIRKRPPLGSYRRAIPRVLGGSWGGGRCLMGEVPLYDLATKIAKSYSSWILSSGRAFMTNTRAQRRVLHTCIISVIVKHHLVHIGRMDGPTEYLS
jgi:hypothetical protein